MDIDVVIIFAFGAFILTFRLNTLIHAYFLTCIDLFIPILILLAAMAIAVVSISIVAAMQLVIVLVAASFFDTGA